MIEARRHRLDLTIPQEQLWIEADRTRLPQLLANLLNNAAKYTTEGGRITLQAARAGAEVVIRVRDTGIGMTAEALANVFELFAQAAGPEHPAQGGLGVGLSLARSIAELHRGVLTAHSEGPGKGSEFTLRLPLAAAPARSALRGSGDSNAALVRRILVVDDNVDAAESLGTMLKFTGHDVRVVHGGRDALTTAREFLPQVMIVDLGMPDVDGYEVARAVRADPQLAAARLIALSGYGQAEDRRRTKEVGFDQHLVKPVEREALDAAIG
jgi:two-component system CheB/CheR fusion protein